MTGAGHDPLSFSATEGGEPFAAALRDELSSRLVDVPLLDLVSSVGEALGPDYHPTATGRARPGLVVVVSPIKRSGERATVGVEVAGQGGAGWEYVLNVTGATATISDTQMAWVS